MSANFSQSVYKSFYGYWGTKMNVLLKGLLFRQESYIESQYMFNEILGTAGCHSLDSSVK